MIIRNMMALKTVQIHVKERTRISLALVGLCLYEDNAYITNAKMASASNSGHVLNNIPIIDSYARQYSSYCVGIAASISAES